MNFKFSILFFALVTVTLFSCKDDDDTNKSIEGTWKTNSLTIESCSTIALNGTTTYGTNGACVTNAASQDVCEVETWVFNNGTVTRNKTFTVDGVADATLDVATTGTYAIDGDDLTITISGDVIRGNATITDTTLSVASNDTGCTLALSATKQ